MSVHLMSLAFKTDVPATRKLVLLALCDAANDQGECYPSINTLVDKCSLGERAIQMAIGDLEADGHLRREYRTGRSTVYWMTPRASQPPHQMHPRTKCTPASDAPSPASDAPPPPHDVHPTPAPRAPRTIKEPSVEPSQKRKAESSVRTPPPPFAGDSNLTELNGKNVVALAVDWELPVQWGIDAEALGWKPADILKESEKFRQYWTRGKGADTRRSVKGWSQSWSNWLQNAERYRR